MKPLITSIAPGSGLMTPLLAHGGRVLVGLRRDDAGLVLCALSVDSGAVLWTESLATRASRLRGHERTPTPPAVGP